MQSMQIHWHLLITALGLACTFSLQVWGSAAACDMDSAAGAIPQSGDAVHIHRVAGSLTFASALVASDTYSATIVNAIALGAAPHGVAVSPDGTFIYVTDFTARSVSVIDAAQLTVLDTIVVGRGAVNVILSKDGSRAYVTNELDETLSVIDTATRQVILIAGDG